MATESNHFFVLLNSFNSFARLPKWLRRSQPLPEGAQPEPEPNRMDPFMDKIYDLLSAHLGDSAFGVNQLADQMAVSRHTLNRKVKTHTGNSTQNLIRAYRLKRALEFLRQGYNSSETAYRVGFESPAYFTKCFREAYGQAPLHYLRRG